MNETPQSAPNRAAAIHTLAVVGFVALIGAGMWLAVYSTRYVPGVVGRIGTAAVYLGSVLTPAPPASLSVVPTPVASTTIPFGESSPTTTPKTASVEPKTIATTAGQKTTTTTQISGAATPNALSGLPDLVVSIKTVGYLSSTSTDSFVASQTVPAGNRPAISFSIKNIGTNATGAWRFSASIPTTLTPIYQSVPQQSLNPGDYIDYTLGFDQANRGTDQVISVTANFDRAVTESNSNNNSASAKVTILGS